MIIGIGNLKKQKSKAKAGKEGVEYFSGYIGNVPILGFYKKNSTDTIFLRVDVEKVNWIDKKEAEKK